MVSTGTEAEEVPALPEYSLEEGIAEVIVTSRTQIITGQRCKRERFLSFHYLDTGLELKKTRLPLAFGAAFHAGEEELFNQRGVEAAVARALDHLHEKFSDAEIDMEEPTTDYAIAEQKAVAEALVRGWAIYNGKRFFADFDILAVEQEGEALLADDVKLQFRPDAVVRERMTGDVFVVSHKTTSRWYGGRGGNIDKARVDMQSMSECFGIQHDADLPVEGVLYSFSVKGQRKMDDYIGAKRQDTPLVYAWHRSGPIREDDEWAWKYQWKDEETDKLTRLGKGFRKVAVWENYPGGVKSWIDDLAAQRIAPRHLNALEEAFPQSLPVSRREDEIESWRRQTVAEERRCAESLVQIGTAPTREQLDEHFPQNSHACYRYASACEMFDICHNPGLGDPLLSGHYKLREPNHPKSGGDDDDS